jgi:RNA binding exosome subunit
VVAHATEDIQKILMKMHDVFLISTEKFFISKAEGHWGNEISIITAECDHNESSALLERIISSLKIGEKNYVLGSFSDFFDEKNNFYIRLNKQSVCRGIIALSEQDAIRIRVKPIKGFNQNNKFKDHVMNLFTRK